MPEGDTVHRTCARLHDALAGRRLLAAELRWPGLSTADLIGLVVTEVVPRGKHILLRLDAGWTLHSHLLMEGQWRIERTAAAPSAGSAGPSTARGPTAWPSADLRARLVTDTWTALGLRLGRLDLVRTAEEHSLVGHLGPDILDPAFDAEQAVANLAAAPGPIGAALLDQTNLAGIGTLWASESLFAERLNPWAEGPDAEQLAQVVGRARRLMLASLPNAVQAPTGIRREGANTWVHGRSGRPCRRCGNTVRVWRIGPPTRERVMFYCPHCQGGPALGDDGRPVAPLGARRRRNRPAG